ncbi:MAG: translocation/assembly module TamB [Flavobacteriaceae bacterium]|nr:translocation/assembly module TamB [Flavobacteriaceae bacterium]
MIDQVDLSNLAAIKLKGIVIKDHHDYPFIIVKNLETSILNYKNILDNKLELGQITLNGLDFVLKTYKNENQDNTNIFIAKFNTKKIKKPFLLTASKLTIKNSKFYLYNENKQIKPLAFYNDLNGLVKNFKIDGPNIYGKVSKTSFLDNHQINVTDFASDFTYTKVQMLFKNTLLKTKSSTIKLDMIFNYKKGDLSDFNNKVQIDATIKKATISSLDIQGFYKELGKTDKFYFTTKFNGTLNNFKLKNVKLVSAKNSVLNGSFHFVNVFNTKRSFSLQSNILNLTSDYEQLTSLLPNVLGKTLPTNFKMFGKFKLKGQSHITKENIDAQLEIKSDLGTSILDLKIKNIDDIYNAPYQGKIELIDFELGKIIKDTLVGKLSMVADVDGIGFTKETLNTSVNGHITKHQYKGYTYSDIDVNGVFKDQHFNGDLVTNDKNIKMTFKGLADLSSQIYAFKFKATVAYANFNRLNLFRKHSKSVLKGEIDIDIRGNNIDNMVGTIKFSNASYTNHLDNFNFKNFNISSNFKDEVRTLKVSSKDIINGRIIGKFKFRELPTLAKNSLASIYTNYKPDSVSVGQFLDFNFNIYDKIIGVFYPEIKLGKNTSVKGKINSDKEKFELTFKSPMVEMKDNLLEKIRLQIDNKNPLYNTILSVRKINTKYYNVADLNFINITLNDTLFIQTNFIGGKDLKETYNLSLYHTINNENKSVVGLKKSDLLFKNQKWFLNKFNDNQSKVIFDNDFKDFDFKKIELISGNQKIDLIGSITNRVNKDFYLNFNNILLDKIVPKIDSITLDGIVNGKFNFNQKKDKITPKIDLNIAHFKINNFKQGDLLVKVQTDKSFKKYEFEAVLTKASEKPLSIFGFIDTKPKKSIINATLKLSKLDLKPYSPLGGNAISNIRGNISGNAKFTGLLKNPNMKGDLYLENTGFSFPYLAVDYIVKGKQKITLNKQEFNFNTTKLIDTKKQTEAILTGEISYLEFKKWYLDLAIDSDNFLVLNTQEDEETPYYGTALIDIVNGEATIKGYTDALTIKMTAKTNKGTEFIVPLSNVSTIEENKLVRFVNMVKDNTDLGRPNEIIFDKKGLTLIIALEVTPEAQAEIVIDKATGSVLKGKGFAYLDIEINTKGKFEMFGTYIVDQGEYQLKNIVNKTFKVNRGGKITWNGSPFDAFLDIEAINNVKANPSILLENVQGTRDIDVDLITKITGNLYEPQMEFDIKLPNAGSIVQSELAFKINDEDKKMTQFLSLLSSGTFINFDNVDFANSGSSFLVGTLSERISSAVSNLLKSENDKFQVGVNLEIGDENSLTNLRTDDQVGVTLQTKILKKITLNGVVGVPINSNSQSGVTGEIEAELPLNKSENFKAKMYNRRNEVQFDVLDTEGYTQGIGLSYQFNWNTGSEFLEKTGLKRTKEQKEKMKLKKEIKKRKKDSLKKINSKNLIKLFPVENKIKLNK